MSHAKKLSSQMLAEKVRQFLDTKLSDIPGLQALKSSDKGSAKEVAYELDLHTYDMPSVLKTLKAKKSPILDHEPPKDPSQLTIRDYLWSRLGLLNIPVATKQDFDLLMTQRNSNSPRDLIQDIVPIVINADPFITSQEEADDMIKHHIEWAERDHGIAHNLEIAANGNTRMLQNALSNAINRYEGFIEGHQKRIEKNRIDATNLESEYFTGLRDDIFIELTSHIEGTNTPFNRDIIPDYITDAMLEDFIRRLRQDRENGSTDHFGSKAVIGELDELIRQNQKIESQNYKVSLENLKEQDRLASFRLTIAKYILGELKNIAKIADIQIDGTGPNAGGRRA